MSKLSLPVSMPTRSTFRLHGSGRRFPGEARESGGGPTKVPVERSGCSLAQGTGPGAFPEAEFAPERDQVSVYAEAILDDLFTRASSTAPSSGSGMAVSSHRLAEQTKPNAGL